METIVDDVSRVMHVYTSATLVNILGNAKNGVMGQMNVLLLSFILLITRLLKP